MKLTGVKTFLIFKYIHTYYNMEPLFNALCFVKHIIKLNTVLLISELRIFINLSSLTHYEILVSNSDLLLTFVVSNDTSEWLKFN